MSQPKPNIDHPSDVEIPGVLVVNPLPWSRTVSGRLSRDVLDPRGWYDDPTSTRHHQDRDMDRPLTSAVYHIGEFFGFYNAFGEGNNVYLPPTELPPFGYAVVPTEELLLEEEWPFDERATVQTDRYEITFDRNKGGIKSWYDTELACEWVDENAEHPLGGFVYERISDLQEDRPRQLMYRTPSGNDIDDPLHPPTGWQPDWNAHYNAATKVTQHRVYDTPTGLEVRQTLSAPGVVGQVELCFHVPSDSDAVIVEANWTMGLEQHPESTYLAFPFDLPDPTAYVDVGGQAMQPGRDQLDGSCFDYYTAQRWVELANNERGITVGCPINPLFQFGGFHFGDKQQTFKLDRALVLGWVTNNYWDTNFRAHQPGQVRARYHLCPHNGPFDEANAHQVGFEAEHWKPLVNSLNEEPLPAASLPESDSLLSLPEPPVLVLQIKPEEESKTPFYPAEGGGQSRLRESEEVPDDAAFTLLLRNASDEPQTATLGSGVLSVTGAVSVGLLHQDEEPLETTGEGAAVELAPRETIRVQVECEP